MFRFRIVVALLLCAFVPTVANAQGSRNHFSINVRDVDIYTVLSLLASESGANIVADNTTVKHDKVTLSLHNVDFDTALRTIELSDGLQDVRQHGVIFVASSDAISRHFAGAQGGQQTRLFELHNADVTLMGSSLSNALPLGTIIVPDTRTHSILITGDPETLGRAGQIISQLDQPLMGRGSNGSVVSQMVHLRFAKSSDVAFKVRSAVNLPPGSSIIPSDDQNALVITGSQDLVNTVQAIASNLDQPGEQVTYEVRVVDVEPVNDVSNVGIQFGGVGLDGKTIAGATATAFTGRSLALNATINAAIANGHGQTLATPKISVLNNREGSLLIGETRPVSYVNAQTGALQVQFIDIGVKLRLTPTIGSDGYVTTDLHPEFSSLLGVSEQGIPIISNRKVDTVARVKDGESIVLAGLLQDIANTNVQKVPWLGDMPVFGGLFKDKSTTHTHDEVIFIITPHIETPTDTIPTGSTPLHPYNPSGPR